MSQLDGNWLLEGFVGLPVVVIGDAVLDRYVETSPQKLCSEGPVPVVWRRGEVAAPGGAANVAANLAALGARVRLVGVTGEDEAGLRLRDALRGLEVDADLLLADGQSRTHTKTRILADGHYVVRVDDGATSLPLERLEAALRAALPDAAAVVLSDYGLGVLDDRVIALIAACRPAGPLLVDAKRPDRFRRLRPAAVTPNVEEATAMVGPGKPPVQARRVATATGAGMVALTLGAEGAYVLADGMGHRIPARPAVAASEVGAGDSFVAAFALGLAAGAPPAQAAAIAVEAAGVAVAKRYTATVTAAELARALDPGADRASTALAELLPTLERRRRRGDRIVFTNGVFDLLHPGHVDFLRQARRLGDALVVGVNADASVRRLKGEGRPVLHETERLALVAALDCVDHVVPFDADTAVDLLRAVRPDVYVKGGDYRADLPEGRAARRLGVRVVILPRTLPSSTTSLIQRVHRLPQHGAPAAGG
jgi:D-beta-D-heptose 7-phosphate kinase / D-beta-D-heptose 1-phosphate adenosyltransferase